MALYKTKIKDRPAEAGRSVKLLLL